MSKTLSGTYSAGYLLHGADWTTLNPVTVTGSIDLGTSTLSGALYAQGPAPWTVTNQGEITGGTVAGIDLAAGGVVTNASPGVLNGMWGVYVNGGQGTVTNDGSITAVQVGAAPGSSNAVGILLAAGGTATNQADGHITGGWAIAIEGAPGSVLNSGSLNGTSQSGVYLESGSVTNASGGQITGVWGVVVHAGGGSVANAGTIKGGSQIGAYLDGGNVTNTGVIGGTWGIVINGSGGTVTNSGSVTAAGQSAVFLKGGVVSNAAGGIISGTTGVAIGTAAGTVVNAGTIAATGSNNVGITLTSQFADRVVDEPGAVFVGTVDGANTIGSSIVSTLELGSGASQGILSGLGTQFIDFGQVAIDDGADWIFQGSNNLAAGATLADQGTLLVNGGTTLGAGKLTIGADGRVSGSQLVLQGAVRDQGGTLDANEVDVTASGPFAGAGTLGGIGHLIVNAGSIEANVQGAQKTLTLAGTVVGNTGSLAAPGTGSLLIDSGTTLALDGPVDGSQALRFADATGVLELGDIGGFAGTITNFVSGDTIIVSGTSVAATSLTNAGHTLRLLDGASSLIGTLTFDPAVDASEVAAVDGVVGPAPCLVAGTRVATARGDVAMEDLREGDLVRTLDGGHAPVVWLGHREVACAKHPRPDSVWPVRVRAGAFGPGRPARDLYLSPDHAVFLRNVLIPIRCLISGESIARVRRNSVTYYHVELPRHDVMLAEGLPVESYLDTGDRSNFENGGGAMRLFADFATLPRDVRPMWEANGYAPLVIAGPELAAARALVRGLKRSRRAAAA